MTSVFQIKRLYPNGIVPTYQTTGAAGADLHATETVDIPPMEWRLIGTGLAFAVPEGYEVQIRPRSGLAVKHGVTVLNSPGTIDSDYTGEVKVILINHGKETFQVMPGDRIAQMVLAKVQQAHFTEVLELSGTSRGAGGFGSTGRN